jgi:uncharacterized membrane protein
MSDSPRYAPRRLLMVDALRGAALAAMVVYHFSWDLAYHRLVAWDVVGDPVWRGFAAGIASSFLMLAGVSLVLAARGGVDPGAFLLRFMKIAAAAAVISVATRIALPDGWIFFGILHLIALGSLLGLVFIAVPAPITLVVAAGVAILPHVVRFPALDGTLLAFTGLAARSPAAYDFVPLFPWFSAMLVGIAVGRLIVSGTVRVPEPAAPGRLARGMALAGRWTLPVYLVHQVVLFGLVFAAASILPARPSVERAMFVRDCQAGCTLEGADPGTCSVFCGCVADALEGTGYYDVRGGDEDLWPLASSAAAGCRISDLPDD